LVHLVLTGSQCRKVYQSAYRAIAAALRYYGNEVEYFGCFENEDEAGKGMHVHLYLLIETDNQFPWTVLDVRDGKWLHKFATKRGLKRVHIAPPQNKMHRRADGSTEFFARPVAADGRLADCLSRISYLFKMRSKAGMVSRETYFNSEIAANVAKRAIAKAQRTSRKAKPVPVPVTPPAPTGFPVALPASRPLVDTGKVADEIETMSSVEIVEAINTMRSPMMGKLDHDSFMLKVNEVLGFASTAYLGFCKDSTGNTVKCYHLPKRESNLMMMADSLEVQTQVYDRLAVLEEQAAAAQRPQTYGEALLALAEKVEKEEALQLEHASTSNPPALPVDYRAGPTTNEGDAVTPAEQYVASKYEEAVDQQLDVDALRLFLLEQGIRKTPAQVAWELEEKYGFLGYASRYPAPAKPHTRMLDVLIDRTPLTAKRHRRNLLIPCC